MSWARQLGQLSSWVDYTWARQLGQLGSWVNYPCATQLDELSLPSAVASFDQERYDSRPTSDGSNVTSIILKDVWVCV
jgi:hypothetical protein